MTIVGLAMRMFAYEIESTTPLRLARLSELRTSGFSPTKRLSDGLSRHQYSGLILRCVTMIHIERLGRSPIRQDDPKHCCHKNNQINTAEHRAPPGPIQFSRDRHRLTRNPHDVGPVGEGVWASRAIGDLDPGVMAGRYRLDLVVPAGIEPATFRV